MALSPRVLSLAALPAFGPQAPHLVRGVHLRWTYHPLLGFPNGPVEISRASLDDGLEEGCERRDVHISETGQGAGATLPIGLGPGQRVWCRPLTAGAGTLAMAFVVAGIAPEQVVAGVRGPAGFLPVQYGAGEGSVIWVTAAGVDSVSIVGPGRIIDAWSLDLDCARAHDFETLAYVGPAVGDLSSYQQAPLVDPRAVAEQRVRDGAPVLTSLVDAVGPSSVSPSPNTQDREWDRVLAFIDPDLSDRYTELLDSGEPPLDHSTTEALASPSRDDAATIDVPSHALVMGATRDPSVARWAGLSMVDRDPHQSHSLYRIRASFDLGRLAEGRDESLFVRRQAVRNEVIDHALEIGDPRTVLEAYVAVVPGSQLPLPGPSLDVSHVRWLTAAPDMRRLADVQFDRPVGAVGYSWYRQDPSIRTSLNALRTHTPYRQMASASRVRPGGTRWALSDGTCPPSSTTFAVAATDGFGRWSTWSLAALSAGALVPPPAPVPEAFYEPADRTPVDDAPRAGSVRVVIPVPTHLPPGGAAIDVLDVRLDDATSATVDARSLAVGAAEEITVVLSGPALERGEVQDGLQVIANFEAGGMRSADGVARIRAADPRPPPSLDVVPALRWTTRSDALDSSRLRLEWSPLPSHRSHRVYIATTRTLVPHFAGLGVDGATVLAAMSSPSVPLLDIVAALNPHVDSLPRSAFELVTSTAVPSSSPSHEVVVPGRSRLLYIVRVTSVGANGVEEPWSEDPALYFVGVPPTVKLQPPELAVAVADATRSTIRVSATLRGGHRAAAWRVFRTTKPDLAVAGKMSELVTAAVSLPPDSPPTDLGPGDAPGAGVPTISAPLAVLDFDDDGPTLFSPDAALRPWRTYIYRAQIQAEAEPGGPPGVWSDLSRPVRTTIVPDDQPTAAVVTASRTGRLVSVTWMCELAARRTAVGDFRFRVLELRSGSSVPRTLGSVGSLVAFRLDHEYPAADGVLPAIDYFVETIDPVGRRRLSEATRVEGDV